jgi:hypothetical protein
MIGLGMAWGPGLILGIAVAVLTSHWYFGALAFAVTCSVMTIVYGTIGARLLKRDQAQKRS